MSLAQLGPGTLVGPYRLERLLGRGGMAVVYEATHESIGRTVALKLVSPDLGDPGFIDRFRNEGRMQAALDHPHVVTVYEAGTADVGPYLAMRLIRGTTLAGLIDDGALTVERTLAYLEQIAGALDAAHAAGLVHRDVKPRNILVDDQAAYLADFGLTKLGGATGVTATGHFMGTLAYIAPEIVRGEQAGPASDRYALAAVLFECLTGSVVFPRESQVAVLYAHTNEPPPRISRRREDLPEALDDVLAAGLAKEPDDRPGTATELIAAARAALGSTELGPPAPRVAGVAEDDATSAAPVVVTAPRPARRTRRGALVLAALAGAAVAAVGALLLDDDDGGGRPAPAAITPPVPAGMVALGSTLAPEGELVDCRGEQRTPRSPGCTVFQESLDGATLVVPRRGVVRQWSVRSASGELALTLLRRRENGYFQVYRSRSEFPSNLGVHTFQTDIPVDSGDRLGLVVIGGSGYGREPGAGATGRFIPILRGVNEEPSAGPPGELLLRVDYEPGGRRDLPRTLEGDAAAAAPEGERVRYDTAVFENGQEVEVRVVLVDGQGVLDLLRDGTRVARMDVPGLLAPLSGVVNLEVGRIAPDELGIDIEFLRPDSMRLEQHYFYATERRLIFEY